MPKPSPLGASLQRAREGAGLTQEEAAAAIGVTWKAVAGWEQGAFGIKDHNLVALAKLYRVTPSALRYGNNGERSGGARMVRESAANTYVSAPGLPPAVLASIHRLLAALAEVGLTAGEIEAVGKELKSVVEKSLKCGEAQ